MKVRINYNGSEFEVQGESESMYFYGANANSKRAYFEYKANCTVLQSDTQPEQWVPKVGEFVIAFANPIRREFWGHTGKCIISEECDYVFEFNKEEQVDSMLSGVRKALPNEIPAPEPSSKAILDNSPKLIAKAGEWVKPTYFDKCFIMTNNNGCGLVLNDPVLLHQDLYSDSTKIYIESRYGIQHNEPDLGKTRFELCPAPVSEPVQVDTPIERIGVGVEDIIKYIENDAEIAIPINDFFNEDGSHITKKQYGHILLKYLCIELREKFSITKPIE